MTPISQILESPASPGRFTQSGVPSSNFGVYSYDPTRVSNDVDIIPTKQSLAISSVWPNPFSGSATVELTSSAYHSLTVEVYNVLGQKQAFLFDGPIVPNETLSLKIDATQWRNGVYIVYVTGADVNPVSTMFQVTK